MIYYLLGRKIKQLTVLHGIYMLYYLCLLASCVYFATSKVSKKSARFDRHAITFSAKKYQTTMVYKLRF